MKARLAVILIVIAVAAVAFVVIRFPSARRPVSVAPVPVAPPPQTGPASPRQAVVSYVEALYRQDFQAAYDLLSAESQRTHSLREFRERARSGGATSLDLAAAREGEERDGRVVVTVPVAEDPAEAGFTAVREGDGWRIVYIGGAPWFPYPEQEAGR